MKDEVRIFDLVMVFAFLVAIVYGVWTGVGTRDGVEPIGTIALILTGGLALVAGSYIRFASRRLGPRPEDQEEADIEEGAGELGFFSPGSYWPVALAGAVAFAGVALAFFYVWMLVGAFVLLILTVGGLLFEYHTGAQQE